MVKRLSSTNFLVAAGCALVVACGVDNERAVGRASAGFSQSLAGAHGWCGSMLNGKDRRPVSDEPVVTGELWERPLKQVIVDAINSWHCDADADDPFVNETLAERIQEHARGRGYGAQERFADVQLELNTDYSSPQQWRDAEHTQPFVRAVRLSHQESSPQSTAVYLNIEAAIASHRSNAPPSDDACGLRFEPADLQTELVNNSGPHVICEDLRELDSLCLEGRSHIRSLTGVWLPEQDDSAESLFDASILKKDVCLTAGDRVVYEVPVRDLLPNPLKASTWDRNGNPEFAMHLVEATDLDAIGPKPLGPKPLGPNPLVTTPDPLSNFRVELECARVDAATLRSINTANMRHCPEDATQEQAWWNNGQWVTQAGTYACEQEAPFMTATVNCGGSLSDSGRLRIMLDAPDNLEASVHAELQIRVW